MYERRKQILKIGAVALVTIGLCGWVVYRLLYPDTTVQYNDFVIDSAVKWLENADDGDFGECRKDIVDKDGWFDWFVKDRKSLKDLKQRNLLSRSALSGTPAGMKHYELKFDSKFSAMKHPRNKVAERMIIESDGKKQFKVLLADYPRVTFYPVKRPTLSENDRQQFMAVAAKVLRKLEARDIEFFKHEYAKYAKRESYFGWNGYWLGQAKQCQ